AGLDRGDDVAVKRPGMLGVEARGDRWMVRVAVGEADDLEAPGLRVFLHAQLLEGIQGISVPRPVLDRIPHPAEFDNLVIASIFPAQQCAAGLVRIAPFEMLPHAAHDRSWNS